MSASQGVSTAASSPSTEGTLKGRVVGGGPSSRPKLESAAQSTLSLGDEESKDFQNQVNIEKEASRASDRILQAK